VIAALNGKVVEKNLNDLVLDVNGVGYRVFVSLITLARLPELGAPCRLRIRTIVREDALDLYGFMSREEEDLFLLLTSVSHVGPKLASGVLSGLEVPELVAAIGKGDVARLTKIHGVGKKTAERLVLELKDKMKTIALEANTVETKGSSLVAKVSDDLISALLNLGYKPIQAENAAKLAAERAGENAPFELQFREALKSLKG
jgi:holliday junction DNA helicase RuvA